MQGPVPNGPFDMLALREIIDDRNDATEGSVSDRGDPFKNPTTQYSDLYQTSQNAVFGLFSSYDFNDEGAWTIGLVAEKNGRFASVSICIHTPGEACNSTPLFSALDHFQCYDIDDATRLKPRPKVSLSDQFGLRNNVRVKKRATSYCTPVDKNGEGLTNSDNTLTCYKTEKGRDAKLNIEISNQFGEQKFKLKKPKLLCVPSIQVSSESRNKDDDDDDDNDDDN